MSTGEVGDIFVDPVASVAGGGSPPHAALPGCPFADLNASREKEKLVFGVSRKGRRPLSAPTGAGPYGGGSSRSRSENASNHEEGRRSPRGHLLIQRVSASFIPFCRRLIEYSVMEVAYLVLRGRGVRVMAPI